MTMIRRSRSRKDSLPLQREKRRLMGHLTGCAMVSAILLTSTTRLGALTSQDLETPPAPAPVFVENRGQWDMPVDFVGRRGTTRVGVSADGVWLATSSVVEPDRIRQAVVKLRSPVPALPKGVDLRPDVSNYFLGSDPARWQTAVPGYQAVQLVQPGGSRTVHWGPNGLELELRIEAGVEAAAFDLLVEGARFQLAADGAVVAETALGNWRLGPLSALRADADSDTKALACRYRLLNETALRFEIDGRNVEEAVILQHGLEWSTFFGSPNPDWARHIGMLPDGNITAVGIATSADFPVTPGAWDQTYGGGLGSLPRDIFVSRLDGTGSTLLWSTYLGGVLDEDADAVLQEPDGSILLAGWAAGGYPTTPRALQPVHGGFGDGFVTHLDANGQSLLFSTFFGGESIDDIRGVARRPDGHYVIVGSTRSTDFQTTPGAFVPGPLTGSSMTDAFLAMISSDGTRLLYSTLFGGQSGNLFSTADAVVLDSANRAFVFGLTNHPDFPTTPGAYDTTYAASRDVFVSCVDMAAGGLVASTYFGGTDIEQAVAIDIDSRGQIVILGRTEALNGSIPVTSDAFDPTWNGFEDNFIARFTPDLQTLVYSTYLGGPGRDMAASMVLESSGAIVVAGSTTVGFPTTPGAYQQGQATGGSNVDYYVYRLAPDGASLHYSTYIGGSGTEVTAGIDVAVDDAGAATVVGGTTSNDFPTTAGAYDPVMVEVGADAIIARLTLLPLGVSAYGSSTPGCAGPLTLGVTALPALGTQDLLLTCTDAPPESGLGVFALSLRGLGTPQNIGGAAAWVDVSQLLALLPLTSDDVGYAQRPLRIPNNPLLIGLKVFVQAFWQDSCAADGLSASNALSLEIQP
jgi:hypothetical protein